MPDIKRINTDSASLGANLPDSYLNQDMPWRPRDKKEPVVFRKGEIIHGEITEIISAREAFVRLPSGVMRALVAGNLKKGDSLFFQVQETEPYLVLKIFSSHLKKDGMDIHEDELVRILDLPDDNYFKSIISFFREKKSVITRDDVFNIEKASAKIGKDYLDDLTMQDLFSIVYFMQENKIPHTSANFQKLKPAFHSPGLIHEKMSDLDRQIDKYEALSTKYQVFFDSVRQNDIAISDRINQLNSFQRRQSLLGTVLKDIEGALKSGKIDEHLSELLSFFWQLTESAAYMKKSSENEYNPYFLFIPVNISMFFSIARFTVRNIRKGEQVPQIAGIKLTDIMNSIIQTDSFMEERKSIRHGLFSQSEKACRILGEKLNRLSENLLSIGIESISVLVSNFPDDDFEIILKSSAGQMKNFSIVV